MMNRFQRGSHRRRGFTLLELLMVLAIMGILAGLAGSGAAGLNRLISQRSDEALLLELVTACRLYRLEKGAWPAWLDDGLAELGRGESSWREDLQPFMERPLENLPGGRRLILLVDRDGDRWIPGAALAGLGAGAVPERIPGLAAACSLDSEGSLQASSWDDESE